MTLHCLGGFVLAVLYGLPRHTSDVDYVEALPPAAASGLLEIAGRNSALHRKHGLYFQEVHVADVPENYADRLKPIFPGKFSRLELLGLEAQDIVLAKLVRNHPVDLKTPKFLSKAGILRKDVLHARYYDELRPNLSNQARHDLTLQLWLESCFGA